MTKTEAMLWARLRRNQLGGYHFRRQQIILGAIVDFYCHAAGLVIEIDGPIHDQHKDDDAARDEVLTSAGFQVMRFRNEEVETNTEAVLEKILQECDPLIQKKQPS